MAEKRLIDVNAVMKDYCDGCPANIREDCKNDPVCATMMVLIEAPTVDESDEYKRGEWEMFERISNAYWLKQMYFLNEDGTVYSRYSCKSMTKDEAFCEFLGRIAED